MEEGRKKVGGKVLGVLGQVVEKMDNWESAHAPVLSFRILVLYG